MPELEFGQYWIPQDTDAVIDTVADSVVPSFITSGFGSRIEPILRMTDRLITGWDFILLAVVLLLVVLNKHLFPRQFQQLFSVPLGVSYTNQLLREWNPVNSFIGLTFFFCYIVVISLFAMKSCAVLTHDYIRYSGFGTFLIFFAVVSAWFILRCLNLFLMNWLFRGGDVVYRQMAVQLSMSFFSTLTIFLLLLIFLNNPIASFVWIGVGIIVLCSLIRFFTEYIETKILSKIPLFYIFFYLCTLEIVPVILLLVTGFRYYSGIAIF